MNWNETKQMKRTKKKNLFNFGTHSHRNTNRQIDQKSNELPIKWLFTFHMGY